MQPIGYTNRPDQELDALFAALADPTRRAILTRLAEGDATVGELSEPFDISQPAVSKHLKVLEKAGLIDRRIDGSCRPSSLNPNGLAVACSWLEEYRALWEAKFDQLDELLSELTEENR